MTGAARSALDRLNGVGVGFVSITENLDFTTPWGKLTLAVLGTLAEIYLDRLSAETSKGKRGPRPEGPVQRQLPCRLLPGQLRRPAPTPTAPATAPATAAQT